jgi:predicted nucleic acid-binding protein
MPIWLGIPAFIQLMRGRIREVLRRKGGATLQLSAKPSVLAAAAACMHTNMRYVVKN